MQAIAGISSLTTSQKLAYEHAVEVTLSRKGIIVTDDQIVIATSLSSAGIVITGEHSIVCM
jgi:hypothetical protein